MTKELLMSVTKSDLEFEYFSGSGSGGQHRNKHQNCCRCKHVPSKAVGICQEHKSKDRNTKVAFRRMAESKEFQTWLRFQISKETGLLAELESRVDKELAQNLKVEIKDETGKWKQVTLDSL